MAPGHAVQKNNAKTRATGNKKNPLYKQKRFIQKKILLKPNLQKASRHPKRKSKASLDVKITFCR
jgi:hypothetical protein